jgi:hypothetical protein
VLKCWKVQKNYVYRILSGFQFFVFCRRISLSGVPVVTLLIVVLLGSSAQIVSETTSESNPCGNMSTHDDPASSYTCRSNSAKCCRGLSSSDWNGTGDAMINYNC